MKNIIVVGSANMDLVVRTTRFPRAGETVLGGKFMTAFGGKGANQAVAGARLGGRVDFVGCLGDDAFGNLHRESMAREHVGLDNLKILPEQPTGTAVILLTDTGENTIVVAPGANNALAPDDILALRGLFQEADVVISQLEIPLETVESTLRLARECGTLSFLDTGPARPLSPAVLGLVDIVSPNESEAETLTGIRVDSTDAARSAANRLREMGAGHVVMKLGSRGCLYVGPEELYQPAFEIEAVDTTGAGDAFTAALAIAWDRLPLREALLFANAAGALAATVAGAQPSMPKREAVIAFLRQRGCEITGLE